MPKKRRRISASEFSNRFTKIVSRHLSALPPEEQDKRIKNAERTSLSANRAERPTTRRVEETRAIPLLSRTHE
ncbi:MAG: hypothetical protein WAO35_14770 [Terriglobia bacterium]